jgi:hypothetical protein
VVLSDGRRSLHQVPPATCTPALHRGTEIGGLIGRRPMRRKMAAHPLG